MAYVSPMMGLTVWNGPLDLFNHDQMAKNWAKIDVHDHTGQRGVQIPTEGLFDTAVTPPKMSRAYLDIGPVGKRTLMVNTVVTFPSAAGTATPATITHNWNVGSTLVGFMGSVVESTATVPCYAFALSAGRTANSVLISAAAPTVQASGVTARITGFIWEL